MMEEKSHQKEHDICFLTTFPNRSRDNPIQFPFPVANNLLQKKGMSHHMAAIAAGETFWAAGC
jgi:hypothetical protein